MQNKTKRIVQTALMIALAMVLTRFPQIPTGTGGYVHFGDSVIYIAAIFMGPLYGAIVGAVGHSLADLTSGYAIFVLPTFIIKGLMGYTIGKIAYGKLDKKHFIFGGIAALIIVTFGYFLAEIPMFGIKTAAAVFISSPIQWVMSLIASAILIPAFMRLKKMFD